MTNKTSASPPSIQLIGSDLPGIYLISNADLIKDMKNRVKINNHEVKTLIKDVHNLGQALQPYLVTFVEGLKEFRENLRTKGEDEVKPVE